MAFEDESVADFFDSQVDRGLKPEQFARIWVHTHPGDSPQPSMTDEDTFARVFGRSDWALMFILARGGQTYARLRFNVGPGGELEIPVDVDFDQPFGGSDHAAWEQEYVANVQAPTPFNDHPRLLRNVLAPAGAVELRNEKLAPAMQHASAGLMAEENDLLLSEILGDDPNGWDQWDRYLQNEQSEGYP